MSSRVQPCSLVEKKKRNNTQGRDISRDVKKKMRENKVITKRGCGRHLLRVLSTLSFLCTKNHTLLGPFYAGWEKLQAWSPWAGQAYLRPKYCWAMGSVTGVHITWENNTRVKLTAFGGTSKKRISFKRGTAPWEGVKTMLPQSSEHHLQPENEADTKTDEWIKYGSRALSDVIQAPESIPDPELCKSNAYSPLTSIDCCCRCLF